MAHEEEARGVVAEDGILVVHLCKVHHLRGVASAVPLHKGDPQLRNRIVVLIREKTGDKPSAALCEVRFVVTPMPIPAVAVAPLNRLELRRGVAKWNGLLGSSELSHQGEGLGLLVAVTAVVVNSALFIFVNSALFYSSHTTGAPRQSK